MDYVKPNGKQQHRQRARPPAASRSLQDTLLLATLALLAAAGWAACLFSAPPRTLSLPAAAAAVAAQRGVHGGGGAAGPASLEPVGAQAAAAAGGLRLGGPLAPTTASGRTLVIYVYGGSDPGGYGLIQCAKWGEFDRNYMVAVILRSAPALQPSVLAQQLSGQAGTRPTWSISCHEGTCEQVGYPC